MDKLYRKIVEAIRDNEDLFAGNTFDRAPFVDLYDQQPLQPEAFEFTLPALFFDYAIDWQPATNTKTGKATVEVHVLTPPFDEANAGAVNIDRGLDRLRYYQIVADILEGIEAPNTTPLRLITEQPVTTDYFSYHKLAFETVVTRRYYDSIDRATIGSINPSGGPTVHAAKIYNID